MTKKHQALIDDTHRLTMIIHEINTHIDFEQAPYIYFKKNKQYFKGKLENIIDDQTASITYDEPLPIGEALTLLWGELEIPIYPRGIVRTDWFEKHYTNTNIELGAAYQKNATTFTIWAPTATAVKLVLDHDVILMQQQKRGIWKLMIHGDWDGFPYHYEATVNGENVSVNDPYAKALLANSKRSVVIDLEKTNPDHFLTSPRPKLDHLADAIIYELHVRDATIDENSGVIHRGKFIGLTEKKTTTQHGYSTGLSYIKELGCTHVQLLPINDFARVDELNPHTAYNWGYDPLYFQVPEGSYSLQPQNPATRIHEVKQMVHTFHEEGLSVILDVVYNHVFIMEESPFEKLVPGYYFRYHQDGTLSNGTGVGNDIATERKMVRKFILDTIDYWLSEYQVDGFRFDLMGAMDIETMKCIKERCLKEPVPIMLLGEGWQLQTALDEAELATSDQSRKLPGIRFFNDYFRDSLKGNLFDINDRGYVNGNGHFVERLSHLVSGSTLDKYEAPFTVDVNQTINFVECHDNHTLWDRLQLTNEQTSKEDQRKMHQLATGITLLSQGVPFIHAGQEWFRTKQGDENSYISGDLVNQLDWEQREVEHSNVLFLQKLIALRKKHDVFRLQTNEEISDRLHVLKTPDPVFGFSLFDHDYIFGIYMNPTNKSFDIHLPSLGKWKIVITNIDSEAGDQQINGEFSVIKPYELIVLKKRIHGNS